MFAPASVPALVPRLCYFALVPWEALIMRTSRSSFSFAPSFLLAPLATTVALTALALLGLLARPLVASETGSATLRPVSPIAIAVEGEIVAVAANLLAVHETGGAGPVAFLVDAATIVERDEARAALHDLRPGDRVMMGVDPRTGTVIEVAASPVTQFTPSGPMAFLALLALLGAAILLRSRRSSAVVPTRLRSLDHRPRLLPAARFMPDLAPAPEVHHHQRRPAA